MLKLRSPLPVSRHTRPVIRPRLIPVSTQRDHGLDGEAHARLRLAHRLVLCVMRNVRRAMEELIDPVTAVSLDDATVICFGHLLDRVAIRAEECTGLDKFDCFVEAVPCGFYDAHIVGILRRCRADVVCFVQIAVKAVVVQGDIDVQNVAVFQGSMIGNAMANDFVDACADGFGEMAVV